MRVVMVAAEARPLATSGGLGDVLGSLPAALAAAGVDVTLVLPAHRSVLRSGHHLTPVANVQAPVSDSTIEARVLRVGDTAVPTFAIDAPFYFDRDELYGTHEGEYGDNASRFVFFNRAVLAWLRAAGRRLDVIHGHDWHTGLLPAFLRADPERYPELRDVRLLHTVHNLAYQGSYWGIDWHLLNLDRRWFTPAHLEHEGRINFLKAGLVFSDAVSTVSPRYAREIQTPEQGCGLDGVLRERGSVLTGILNGIDDAVWDPSVDAALPAHFSLDDPTGKAACTAALRAEVGLPATPGVPLVCLVTRLTWQKGVDLVLGAMDRLLRETPVQIVVLGTGDAHLEDWLRHVAASSPTRVAVRIAFDEPLSHRVIAGADLLLMPSRWEPCGLTQMYAQRYGTLPIVHVTGGLDDTVVEAGREDATGFKFPAFTVEALLDAVGAAVAAWRDHRWRARLMRNAMRTDHSWRRAARDYAARYRSLLRRG
jgi:starch synthase